MSDNKAHNEEPKKVVEQIPREIRTNGNKVALISGITGQVTFFKFQNSIQIFKEINF